MRFENIDCLLFPGVAGGFPYQGNMPPFCEFRVNCFAVRDDTFGKTLTAPLMHCFTPSLAPGEPFQVSLHDWWAAGFHLPSSTKLHVKVVVDGMVQHAEPFERTVGWPRLLIGGNATIRPDGTPELFRHPAFDNRTISEGSWNAYDDFGRIKVEISEGYIEAQTGRYVKNMTLVIFNFQPAPMDVLQRANIAWPNPSMMINPIIAPSLQPANPFAHMGPVQAPAPMVQPPAPMAPQQMGAIHRPEMQLVHSLQPLQFGGTLQEIENHFNRQPGLVMQNPNLALQIPGGQIGQVLDLLNVRPPTAPQASRGPKNGPGAVRTGGLTGAGPGAMPPPPLPLTHTRSRQEKGVQTINMNLQAAFTRKVNNSSIHAQQGSDPIAPVAPMSGSSDPLEDTSSMASAVAALNSFGSSDAAPQMLPGKTQSKKRARTLTQSSQPTERDSPPKMQKTAKGKAIKKGKNKLAQQDEEETPKRTVVFAGPDNA